MFRFFVDKKISDSFILPKEVINHIKVARVTNKEFICIYEEKFYVCKLIGNEAKIIQELDENHEHLKQVVIAPSIIDMKRFEWLIQKAAELGVTKIIPILSENVSKKISGDLSKKVDRWNKIAFNAAEQSFRNIKPIVEFPIKFEEVLDINVKNKFIAHEKTNSSEVIESFDDDVIFLIGPEGGFSDSEVNKANKNDFKEISLGPRILRAETASLFLLSRVKQN